MSDSSKWLRLMLLAFVANGFGPFGLKVIAQKGLSDHYRFQYLFSWYAGGLAFGLAAFLASRGRFMAKDLVMAIGIGAGSFGGQLFSVLALEQKVPGYIVFPITTGGNLFLVAAAGLVLFREKIGRYGVAGIVMGMLAIVLLSLS